MLESGTHSGGAYAPEPLVSGPDRSEQIALYCDDGDMRRRIKGLLPDAVYPLDAPDTFSALLRAGHRLSVVGLRSVGGAHVQWLQHSLGRSLADQSCLVVAPLSLPNLQRVRELDSNVFRVVWDEEADDRLVTELNEVSGDRGWRACPLRSLGRRLLSDQDLRPCVRIAIAEICRPASDNSSPCPPKKSVAELARLVRLLPVTLTRYWRADVPLRCGPKQLLSWAALLWAVDRRAEAKWDTVAKKMRVGRRTLERYSSNLAGCTLAEAAREPEMVRERFVAWVAGVSEME